MQVPWHIVELLWQTVHEIRYLKLNLCI